MTWISSVYSVFTFHVPLSASVSFHEGAEAHQEPQALRADMCVCLLGCCLPQLTHRLPEGRHAAGFVHCSVLGLWHLLKSRCSMNICSMNGRMAPPDSWNQRAARDDLTMGRLRVVSGVREKVHDGLFFS